MTEQGVVSFNHLKQLLVSAPVLKLFDPLAVTEVHTDASKYGFGGVLMQKDPDDQQFHPIEFMSRKTNACRMPNIYVDRNYSVTEQECLAAIVCIKRFRPYIEGHEFTVITDHASLKWLMSQTDLHSRLARWALKLQGLNFKIEHRSGRLNVVPDALSRVNEAELASIDSSHGLLVDLQSPHFRSEEYVK
ncbi:hypothetical protein KR059_012384, partial [Drosophila kikkawai]